MWKWLKKILSPYANPLEKKVALVVSKFGENSNATKIQQQLLRLMQEDLVVVNLWLEANYKGYKNLKKLKRAKLYENARIIGERFLQYADHHPVAQDEFVRKLKKFNIEFDSKQLEQLSFLQQIMTFLVPGNRYCYREASSFAKLLVDIEAGETMIGDCNQIVTLYLFLFSLRYPITDLQLKLVPGHVCLHYSGLDVEATQSQFMKYDEFTEIVSVSELPAINLLDVADAEENRDPISAKALLKSAQIAFQLSSNRDLVEHNLRVSYHNLALASLERGSFSEALDFAKKNGNPKLIASVYTTVVRKLVQSKKFSAALNWAEKSSNIELKHYALSQKAKFLYDEGKFAEARKLYQELGNQQGARACYAGEFNMLRRKVAECKTRDAQKKQKSTYKEMLKLAKKLEDKDLIKQLSELLDRL